MYLSGRLLGLNLVLAAVAAPAAPAAVTFQSLGDFPGGAARSQAFAISDDGSTVVGVGQPAFGTKRAFRWTAAEGLQNIGVLAGFTNSTGVSVSSDGSVIARRRGAGVEGSVVGARQCRGNVDRECGEV